MKHKGHILHFVHIPCDVTVPTMGADETLQLWQCFNSKDRNYPATPTGGPSPPQLYLYMKQKEKKTKKNTYIHNYIHT